jgi:alkylation response protein AidB-like acyl-CoA dehydrogenase
MTMSEPSAVVPPACAAAEVLERRLGDPRHPDSPMSFRRAVELDERDEFPADAVRHLDELAFYENYVPAAFGGAWRDTHEITLLMRLVARRDLTVAIGHGKTFLGAIPVWLDGSPAQRDALRAIIRDRGAVSLALTERDHGSDLAATDVTAELQGDRVVLSGTKWLINNATRGRALSVLARMAGTEPPHPMSMVFVDKQQAPAGSVSPTDKNYTHGIKGADISGVRFDRCALPASAIIGKPGRGFSTVLRLLQVTRIGCCPLSLGAADTALRATLDFALARRLYGRSVWELPYARHLIAGSFVDLLVAEAVAVTAARTLHVWPAQLGIASAIAKYFVPTMVEGLVRTLSVALGARFYLRGGHWDGIFEKLVRDNAIVGLFDGSTVVNLDALGSQLHAVAAARASADIDRDGRGPLFDLWQPLPVLDLSKLTLVSGGRNDVVAALPMLAREIAEHGVAGQAPDVHAAVCALLAQLLAELDRHEAALAGLAQERSERFRSGAFFELTRRYCVFYAASACAHMWWFNRSAPAGFVRRAEWLACALARLLAGIRPADGVAAPAGAIAAVEGELRRQLEHGELFSLLPVRLAAGAPVG